MSVVKIIGAGLAGSEAALTLARLGHEVKLYEMKPSHKTPAHQLSTFAELVCSNSLKAERLASASGLLKREGLCLGSKLLPIAFDTKVPAGGALAVDRERFSQEVTAALRGEAGIELIEAQVETIPDGPTLIATGPLTDETLMEELAHLFGEAQLAFYDAAAPIISAESVDQTIAFKASRYGRGDAEDYLNCPMNKEEYEAFYERLVTAKTAPVHGFERKKLFSGCMPIEEIARTGKDSMRFGPLKPVGMKDPKTGQRPYACVQLRKENLNGEMLNLVGFQTRLTFPEQKAVFSMIPGLQNAQFFRYGVMHRNSFICAPRLLNACFSAKQRSDLFFAGQLTGLEGYVPAILSGLVAALNLHHHLIGKAPLCFPKTTMIGALQHYMTTENKDYQPMTATFGLLPPLEERIKDKQKRYTALSYRALQDLRDYVQRNGVCGLKEDLLETSLTEAKHLIQSESNP